MTHSRKTKNKRTSGARAQSSGVEPSEYMQGYAAGYRAALEGAIAELAGQLEQLEDARARA